MKQRILSAVLALCLLISFPSAAYASPEELSPEEGGGIKGKLYMDRMPVRLQFLLRRKSMLQ